VLPNGAIGGVSIMRVRTMIMKAGFWHYCFIFVSVMATLVMNPAFANPGLPKCPSVGFLHDCTGSFNYSDGAKYDGEWRHDRKHGQGTFTFPDGGEYTGEWKYGNKYGQGTYTFPDGAIYTGAWGADKKNGQGKHTFPDGTVEEGTWKGGELLKPKQVTSPASGSPVAKRILKDIDVLLENAGSLIREGKLSEAVELVLDCSNNGVVKCMMFRASYLQDEGKHEDARAIYLKAAEKGVAEAYAELSILSYRTTDDFLYYRQKAADKGYFRSKMAICTSQLFGYDSEEAAIVLTDMISGVECYRKLKLIKITDRLDQLNLDNFIEDFLPNSLFDETQRNVKAHNLEEEAAYAKSYFYDVVYRDLKKHNFWLDRAIEINNEDLHQRLSRVYLNLPEKINSAGKDYWNKYSGKSNLNQDSTLTGVNPVVADSGLPKCPSGVFHNCTGHKDGYVGEFKYGTKSGQGTYRFSGGRKYKGEFKDDKFNGQGTLTYSDGSKYVGEWKDGKSSGQGSSIYSDGNKYVGKWKDDRHNGQGTLTYSDGRKYVGQWAGGKKNGQGTLTWRNGRKYVGEWKDGKQTGQGTFTYLDGKKYVGEWKDGKKNGQGTLTFSLGRKYVGHWRGDKQNGQGTFTWRDGKKYVGEWKYGKENGRGTLTYSDGRKYIGQWEGSKKNGQGTFTWGDGEKYVGEWKDGKKNGQGALTYPDGAKYVGEFKDGKHNGQGTLTYPDDERLANTVTSSDQGSLATSKKKKTSSWCWINCDPTEAELRDLFVEGLKIIESDMSDPLKTGLFGAFTSAFKTDIKITLKKFKKDWCKKQSDVLYLCQIYTVVGYSTSNREFGNYLTLMGLANKDDSTTQEFFIEKTESGWAVRD
jgi:hypothetical protein